MKLGLQTPQLIVFSQHHTSMNRCRSLKVHGGVNPGNNCHEEKRANSLIFSLVLPLTFYFRCRREHPRSEMEASLLLLCLGLILVGSSGNKMETIKEEFSEGEMQNDLAKSDQEKQTIEILMNLTLLYKNIRGISKDIMSSLLTFRRLHDSFSKGNSPGNDKECYNDIVIWRKVSEANGSCKLSNNFILGSMEVICRAPKTPSCKRGQNLGISCSESPGLVITMGQLTTGKQFPRCQYHSVTSLKKILAVLTGHSLMSWLLSGSRL